ncbi:MAG: DUF6766 family protein [Candidatus Saccharimonadales bacterium]
MKKFWAENSLSIVLFLLFFVFLIGLSLTGYTHENNELAAHGEEPIAFTEYLSSGDFIEAVFENWESEFLQMGALVILTIWLKQKGSADSKKLKGKEDVDTHSRYSIISASSWKNRGKAVSHAVYANSLGIALFLLFFISFVFHALSGTAAANEEALQHGEQQYSVIEYASSSQFWFESFQNWQSEFLAVGALLVLSIYFRQRKSPESKPVGEKNSKTGR